MKQEYEIGDIFTNGDWTIEITDIDIDDGVIYFNTTWPSRFDNIKQHTSPIKEFYDFYPSYYVENVRYSKFELPEELFVL